MGAEVFLGRILMNDAWGPCWELISDLTEFRWGLRALTKPHRAPGDNVQSGEIWKIVELHSLYIYISMWAHIYALVKFFFFGPWIYTFIAAPCNGLVSCKGHGTEFTCLRDALCRRLEDTKHVWSSSFESVRRRSNPKAGHYNLWI